MIKFVKCSLLYKLFVILEYSIVYYKGLKVYLFDSVPLNFTEQFKWDYYESTRLHKLELKVK